MAKETAESKLLKLIEATDTKDGTAAPAAAPSASATAAKSKAASNVLSSVQSVGTIAVPPFIQKILLLFQPGGQGFGLKQINQLLILVMLIIAGYYVMDFSNGLKTSHKEINIAVKQKTFNDKDIKLPEVKDLTQYANVMATRNLFKPFEKKVEETQIVVPVENQQIKDRVANFKLVGISWLTTPESATVMIEDTSTQATVFKRTGEEINGVKIDTIYADRIEISFQGEKLTLNL